MKHILLIALAAVTLFAADATGKWTGTLITSQPDGGKKEGPAHLVLKQEGSVLTGTAGPSADEQHPIENGKSENGNVTFEVAAGESVMKFALKQDGDEIRGDVSREREGQKQTATLAVKRAQ
jgi:hypothetical protein